jgi:[protein-PII] uridylyltransferase
VVHTYADLTAVGPGVASDWKLKLIEELYKRTRRYFDSGSLPGSPDDPYTEKKRTQLRENLIKIGAADSCHDMVDKLPLSLFGNSEPAQLASDMQLVNDHFASQDGTLCISRFEERWQSTRYTVIRREDERSIGTFARACGALSASGVTIMRARIEMVGDLAWDDFWVTDLENPASQSPQHRMDEISERVRHFLDSPDEPMPQPRQTWCSQTANEGDSVNVLPKKVMFDNDSVDRYTIISFFAYNEVGLLYRIASTMAELNLVLHFAKIDTHLDQVADVFYVSETDGSRITDRERQQEIRKALLAATS